MLACTTTYAKTFLGSPRGAWRSTDGGKHWQRVYSLPDLIVTYIVSSPWVPNTFVALTQPDTTSAGVGHGGIWVSHSAGLMWTRINSELSSLTPIGLALLPGKPYTVLFASQTGIHRSSDGGKRWTVDTLNNNIILSFVSSPLQRDLAYAGTTDGIWKTTDAGAHWSRAFAAPPSYPLVPAHDAPGDLYSYASTQSPYIYRVSGHKGLLRGTAPVSGGQLVMSVDPTDASRVYAAWSFPLRVYESNNSGRTWRKIL
jgi:photosystem II stability/assembly factor-like uncharacterized protein